MKERNALSHHGKRISRRRATLAGLESGDELDEEKATESMSSIPLTIVKDSQPCFASPQANRYIRNNA